MAGIDKNWAEQYINDPLTAPDPSDETGPGTRFRPDPETPSTTSARPVTPTTKTPKRLSKNNPFRQSHGSPKDVASTTSEMRPEKAYPSPPPSSSPRHSQRLSGHRQDFLADSSRPRRSTSLKERFPGDPSVRPLDQLAQEKAAADRAKLRTKKHAVQPDLIDNLDDSGLNHYHHEGPYDATLFARNNSWTNSPLAAVSGTNEEALKATPHDKIVDSVRGHYPLDGVAAFPPGMVDRDGQTYNYKEGENMMTEENAPGGPYKRWPGIQYHPDDIKGKGEPSYSIEKALKEHSLEDKETSAGIEMSSNANRSRSGSAAYRAEAFANNDSTALGRSGSLSNKLKKRVGSLKKKFTDAE